MVGFNLYKLIKTQCKEEYLVEISDWIGGLENLDAEMDINRAWETIRYNITISTKETVGFHYFTKHKSCIDEGCEGFIRSKETASGYSIQAK
jgi:hypothetical protein